MKTCSCVRMASLVLVVLSSLSPTQVKGNILVLAMPGHSRWLGILNVARELKTNFGYNTTFVYSEGKNQIAESGFKVITSKNFTKFEHILFNEIMSSVSHGFRGTGSSFSTLQKFGEFCPLMAI